MYLLKARFTAIIGLSFDFGKGPLEGQSFDEFELL